MRAHEPDPGRLFVAHGQHPYAIAPLRRPTAQEVLSCHRSPVLEGAAVSPHHFGAVTADARSEYFAGGS